MKNRHFIFVIIAVTLGLVLFFYNSNTGIKSYPDSKLIFKKYYPENEILGIAFDRNWREVRSSNDSTEDIILWYDQEFSAYTQVENRSDEHCSRKSWQDGSIVTLRMTICNQGDYRTILLVIPK